ncbi:alpha-mannosidase [Pelagicoccus mobilis]|uniref:Alpha-mannosidase n=1 Tax=Pelagicoccus mobilis TaxID=415221 RepID=A0A934S291_9BACT|nr:alpha-mannosidase [Pelagicoccus mobilis]MBK1879855.1 alpha-mannosidase [Pelagicoccus mobilis]
MILDQSVIEKRLENVLTALKSRIHPEKAPLSVSIWEAPSEPVPVSIAASQAYTPFSVGGEWGHMWGTAWMKFEGSVPASWQGKTVSALIELEYEALEGFTVEGLAYQDGKPLVAINVNRNDVPISSDAQANQAVEFLMETAANPAGQLPSLDIWNESDLMPEPGGEKRFTLSRCELAVVDEECQQLYHDFRVLHETMHVLPEENLRKQRIRTGLNQAANFIEAGPAQHAQARELLKPLLDSKNGDTTVTVSAVGHAHIDTAWLWPLRETMRKCARTFSTVLKYMEKYPDYRFSCSQAVQYDWMRQRYPSVYEGIKAKTAAGQWEPVGSMWVEADCNLASGEALVRQILIGKQYFQEAFDYETRDLWLPDVFGYSASLPQIFKLSGIDYFFTQKISWNQTNTFPHHTFEWQGIDGSKVLTHFAPADTYNGNFSAEQIKTSESAFKQKDKSLSVLYPFGFGDGGGGPTVQHIESARRMENLEGLPRVKMEGVKDFFHRLKEETSDLPVWVGELYLELHRGTYTTQAFLKKGNRRNEFALKRCEFLLSLLETLAPEARQTACDLLSQLPAPERAAYDTFEEEENDPIKATLGRAWKLVLLNQFHDIIPGSSIHWVYEDAKKDLETIDALLANLTQAVSEAIAPALATEGMQEPYLLINDLSQARDEQITLANGRLLHATVPAHGYTVIDAAAETTNSDTSESPTVDARENEFVLENQYIKAIVDQNGSVTSLVEKSSGRESIKSGCPGNVFTLHHDQPVFWDAWDVENHADLMSEPLDGPASVTILEQNATQVALQVERSFSKSKLTQKIVLNANSKRLDFVTHADWQESNKLLRVGFPLNLHTYTARCEIQYGHVERPTHRNTSWDWARFEVCAHKWVDLSEFDFGVALLNDCKYGHSIEGSHLRLSLLRAPSWPDPQADIGEHEFTYSLMPHAGDFRTAGVIDEAYRLNQSVQAIPLQQAATTSGEALSGSLLQINSPALICEALKPSEDGKAIVARLYEAWGTRGNAKVKLPTGCKSAEIVNLLEQPLQALPIKNGEVEIEYTPFQIITLKLEIH